MRLRLREMDAHSCGIHLRLMERRAPTVTPPTAPAPVRRTPARALSLVPPTPARVVPRPLNHFSALRTWESMLHLPCVGAACFVKGLRIPFHL